MLLTLSALFQAQAAQSGMTRRPQQRSPGALDGYLNSTNTDAIHPAIAGEGGRAEQRISSIPMSSSTATANRVLRGDRSAVSQVNGPQGRGRLEPPPV